MAKLESPLYCDRCEGLVPPLRPWRGWRPAWNAWKIGLVGVLALFPVLATDFCIMLPGMMLYLSAGGPLRMYARERPVCRRCSLELTEGVFERAT